MSDIGMYVPLKTVVAYALDEEVKSIADFDRCWLLALRGLVMINRDFAGQPQTVRLPVEPNKTVPFPSGLMSWSKIGILDDKGQINTLRVNNAITTYRDNNPNRLEDLTPNINNSIGTLALVPYYSNYFYGGGVYQLFGVGNGVITYGDCTVDEKNRVIVLQKDFKYDSIMLEGIMVPEKNDDYQVMTVLQEAIIMFIRWKLKLASRQEFYAECVAARRAMPKKKVVIQTLNQVLRDSSAFKLRG